MAISQKLHTKLVQKLILTPSLQQAIKLLPMSTLELSELLNQEMVENPMLEEVPTEELQPVEAAQEKAEEKKPAAEKEKDTWDDQDYEYFFGDYLDDGYRPAHANRSQGTPAHRKHALDGRIAVGSPALAAVDADRRSEDARDRRGHHRQPR